MLGYFNVAISTTLMTTAKTVTSKIAPAFLEIVLCPSSSFIHMNIYWMKEYLCSISSTNCRKHRVNLKSGEPSQCFATEIEFNPWGDRGVNNNQPTTISAWALESKLLKEKRALLCLLQWLCLLCWCQKKTDTSGCMDSVFWSRKDAAHRSSGRMLPDQLV